jgi:(+)-trans-carveol dehydrogenase
MPTLDGRVALVTGAARGQGRSHALHLARAGADVIAIDIADQIETVTYPMATKADLDETAVVVAATGRRVVSAVVDVRDAAALKVAVDDGVSELGRLDIIVANAGISGYGRLEQSEQSWDAIIGTNLTGVWNTARAGLPHIVAGARGGCVIIVSSVGGLRGLPNLSAYTASKHGVVGLMRTLAREYAEHRIRVNSVHPTAVPTDMIMNPTTFNLFRPDLDNPGVADVRPAFESMNTLPVPWVEPEDVSKAVLFLVSDDARYITGASLPVDAGALLK